MILTRYIIEHIITMITICNYLIINNPISLYKCLVSTRWSSMYQVTWSFSTFTYHQAEMLNYSFTQCEKTVTGLFTSVKSKFSVRFRSELTTWIKNCYDGVYLEETISPETETLVQRARLRPERSRFKIDMRDSKCFGWTKIFHKFIKKSTLWTSIS